MTLKGRDAGLVGERACGCGVQLGGQLHRGHLVKDARQPACAEAGVGAGLYAATQGQAVAQFPRKIEGYDALRRVLV